jgi:pyrroloquinoline quinone biosynthesis protein B
VLGSAAGGGLPQWNCTCPNCQAGRQGKIQTRTQSCVAISADGVQWFLVNASPDLPFQIDATPALRPSPTSRRNSPILGVLLTNADLDHILGLFSLREGAPLRIYATAAVRQTLESSLGLTKVLGVFCGVNWHEPPKDFSPLIPPDSRIDQSTLEYRAIPLAGNPPPYDPNPEGGGIHSVAYQFRDRTTGGVLVVAPDVASLAGELHNALREADAVLFDGTFWSPDELSEVRPGARTSDQMGHLTMEQSLEFLQALPAQIKAYVHINNTNPALMPGAEQRRRIEAAGLQLAEDGMEFEL